MLGFAGYYFAICRAAEGYYVDVVRHCEGTNVTSFGLLRMARKKGNLQIRMYGGVRGKMGGWEDGRMGGFIIWRLSTQDMHPLPEMVGQTC